MIRALLPLGLIAALTACANVNDGVYTGNGGRITTVQGGSSAAPAANGNAITFVGGATAPRFADAPPTAAANQFAVNFLNQLQPRSIAERREYCGYFYVNGAGEIAASPPTPGTTASCTYQAPVGAVFASYHTHGAYDRGYDNEVPSDADLLGDFQFGVDGYVSTPGGRVWHIEFDDRTARQVCGLNCVYQDPGFVPEDEAGIRSSYTVAQIRQRYF